MSRRIAALKKLQALRMRHRRFDIAVKREMRHLTPDSITLKRLKKKKLDVKDRIRALERSLGLNASYLSTPTKRTV